MSKFAICDNRPPNFTSEIKFIGSYIKVWLGAMTNFRPKSQPFTSSETATPRGRFRTSTPLFLKGTRWSFHGPMLYLLYTSPLGDIVREHGLSFHFYADDSQLYTSFACNDTSDLVAAKQRLENCVADINLWMTANKLKLNNDKSEFLFLHSRFRHSLPPPTISVGMENIRPSQQARNLGVIFDDTMSLSPHVNTIVKGAFYQIRNISKIRKYISTSTTEILIHSFVSSKLDFCNSLLFGAQKRDIAKLQSVQNEAARIIAGLKKRDHITEALRDLHWLPVKERIVFKINLITFKTLNGSGPRYLEDILKFYHQARTLRSSRDHLRLEEPNLNMKTYGQRAFSAAAPRLWNKLPFEIRACSDVNLFKSKLKTFLFKKKMTFSFVIFDFVFVFDFVFFCFCFCFCFCFFLSFLRCVQ